MAGGIRRKADEALALGIAAGGTVEAAARHAGLSERTAYRRLREPTFRQRIAELRAEFVERTVSRLTAMGTGAADGLSKLLASPDERVRLAAIRTTLEYMYRGQALFEVERRMCELHEVIDEIKAADQRSAE